MIFSAPAKFLHIKNKNVWFSQERQSPTISLYELLACSSDRIDEQQLKGIYFEPRSRTFFLFMRRGIYSIPDEGKLIAQNFASRLVRPYLKSPKHLDPYNPLDMFAPSWVKNLRYSSFLVPAGKFGKDVWKITEPTKEPYQKLNYTSYLGLCSGQTLHVESAVFCFDERQYHKFADVKSLEKGLILIGDRAKSFKIASIFKDTGLSSSYTDEQRLKFIFNYGDHLDQFVLMTMTNLFVFDYANFGCEPDNDVKCARIAVRVDLNERWVDVHKNQLFNDSDGPGPGPGPGPEPGPGPGTDPVERIVKTDYLVLLILFLALSLLLLLLCLLLIVATRQMRKASQTSSPSRVLSRQLTGIAHSSLPSETTSFDVTGLKSTAKSRGSSKIYGKRRKQTAPKSQIGFPVSRKSSGNSGSLKMERNVKTRGSRGPPRGPPENSPKAPPKPLPKRLSNRPLGSQTSSLTSSTDTQNSTKDSLS